MSVLKSPLCVGLCAGEKGFRGVLAFDRLDLNLGKILTMTGLLLVTFSSLLLEDNYFIAAKM